MYDYENYHWQIMDKLRIVTLNERGLRGKKRFDILKWFQDNRFDICLVQETYFLPL